MADLTPEEIALGLRAAKVWTFEPFDVVREYHRDGDYASPYDPPIPLHQPMVVLIRSSYAMRSPLLRLVYDPRGGGSLCCVDREGTHPDGSLHIFPDPTARGFVSAALAQVRARTDRWYYIATTNSGRWHVCDEDGFVKTMPHSYPTEAEAVVAALEATRG